MMIAECLELAVGPSVQDPIFDVGPGAPSLVLRLIPDALDLVNEIITALAGRILCLNALLLQITTELVRVPILVGGNHMSVPVLLHELL
jgi:hypothetical protein